MIISHKHKFIFIKTVKTAGTSVEIALSRFCGPRDVITPISPEDEAIRKELGYRGPQNYKIPFVRYSKGDYLRLFHSRRRPCFYNHMSACEIIRYIDPQTWNSYFKFCFERNPWDKVLSWYFWRYKTATRPNIADFVQSREANLIQGFDLYTLQSEILVDKVYRYENLDDAMDELGHRFGFNAPITLPKAKVGFREKRKGYREMLSKDDAAKIARVYAREIAYFDYEW